MNGAVGFTPSPAIKKRSGTNEPVEAKQKRTFFDLAFFSQQDTLLV